jgi:hypothetical protein
MLKNLLLNIEEISDIATIPQYLKDVYKTSLTTSPYAFIEVVYMKFRVEPLISLQKFHLFMHAKNHYKDQPLIEVLMQILYIGLIVVISNYIFNF